MTDNMNSLECGTRRRRLVSATYEGVGARWKEQLSDVSVSVAIYEETPNMEDIARKVASHNSMREGSFYVMDASRVERAMSEWNRSLPQCSPFYPLACNDDPLLLELLTRKNNCHLQVSTLAELELALSLVSPFRIQFHSHLLTRKMLRLIASLQEPLHSVIVDSEECAMDAWSLNPSQPLLLRVSLSPDSDRPELAMGMPVEEAIVAVPRLIRTGVALSGISVQLLGEGENMVERVRILTFLLSTLSPYLRTIDVGDGMESSTLYDTSYLLDCIMDTASIPHVKLMATPGRFFAASPFSLVTSIVGKRSVDAGIINPSSRVGDSNSEGFVYETTESVYGVFSNRMMGETPQCQPLHLTQSTIEGEEYQSAVIGASAIDSFDFPQRHAVLPSLQIGDCLYWKEMGAYGARDEDAFPTFYYSTQQSWLRIQGRKDEEGLLSDGGSEGETDVDSEIDEDDMTECFGRVFN